MNLAAFMQAVFKGTYWLHLWAHLQHEDMTNMLFRRASLALQAVALEIASHGWKHKLRIGLDHFSFFSPPLSQWPVCFVVSMAVYTL